MTPARLLLPPFVLASALVACSPPEDTATEAAEPEQAPATLVETVSLETTSFRETIELTGETAPIRSAVIASQIAGRITTLDVEEGATVTAGQRVLRVDTGTAGAQREQLETQAEGLDRDIRRARSLIDRGIGTQTDLDALETQRALVGDQIAAIDVSIRQGRGEAPISGIVVEKAAEEGEFASPGQPLARIVDVSTIEVMVGLPEHQIRYVREGMTVPVHILATDSHYEGTLTRIGVEADPASRTFPLEIQIANDDGQLRAGMRARVVLEKRDIQDAVVIPRDAVVQGLEGPEVLVDEGGVVGAREVEMGPGRGGYVVIQHGLLPGDSLIVRGHRMLVPGERIRTVDVGVCCAEQLGRFLEGEPVADTPTTEGADDALGG